ncbi:MAG: hypothetical protein DRP74_00430 [Candidatus Omnitrophota bacterium]|nr:MAG: hypothetical protein DRP74_00430 [Candidatus Omnitrophota bacterium]
MKELKCKKCGKISYSASEKSRCPYCSGENSKIELVEKEVEIREVIAGEIKEGRWVLLDDGKIWKIKEIRKDEKLVLVKIRTKNYNTRRY